MFDTFAVHKTRNHFVVAPAYVKELPLAATVNPETRCWTTEEDVGAGSGIQAPADEATAVLP
jgi:hypothetical protein